jgi:Na+/H+ antiporter NhaD/arsenite permease-like protein
MKQVTAFLKKELMLTLSLFAAAAALIITPPTKALLRDIDWRTLGTLLMMLTVLEGFKRENVLRPVIRLAGRLRTMTGLTLFLVFGVFFTSMFVTNDVSLIIFVPLTILLFRAGGKERYLLPVLTLENIAAVRGSLLMPFGSPQNLFLFGQAEVTAWHFMLHMLPLCALSAVLLICFILFFYRRDLREPIGTEAADTPWQPEGRVRRIVYLALFVLVLLVIVTRTRFWYAAVAVVLLTVLATDRTLFAKVDYVLLLTFLCFFVFSSSIAANPKISAVLRRAVAGNEYWWGIGLSQLISNVPATIVLYPFTRNFAGLIYGVDTAGLCSLIGSLASVINYRIYVREYPGSGGRFIKVFTLVSWAFFLLVVIPGLLLSKWAFF